MSMPEIKLFISYHLHLNTTKHDKIPINLWILAMYSLLASAQIKSISGKVTYMQGQTVPFATVRINGGNQGVSVLKGAAASALYSSGF